MDLPNSSSVSDQMQENIQNGQTSDFWNSASSFISGVGNNISNWWNQSALNPGNWQSKIQSMIGNSVNNATAQGEIAYTKSGLPYDKTNVDSQINALMQEYAYKRDDESYDRLIAALKRNGINPAIALSNSASPMSSDSGYRSNYSLTDKDQLNSALKAGSILALLLGLLMRK